MSEANASNGAAAGDANAAGGDAGDGANQGAGSEVNARLLEESKQNKKKAQEYKAALDKLTQTQLVDQQKYKELYEAEQKKYSSLHKTLVTDKVKAAVSEKASKAGAIDLDAILALGDRGLLVVDEDTLAVDGVDTFIEDLKKKKPSLFTAKSATAVNGVTPGGTAGSSNQKQISEMNADEIRAALKKLGK
jgi:hypothetical protein